MSSIKPKPYFLLVDCNQFYVSCEAVFNPRLLAKPTVVLSNNDGCVIARSTLAKKIGIAMGAPIYQLQELIRRHDVQVLSSNFELYGDMSHRVMYTLESFNAEIEEYSIDEAFLKIDCSDPQLLALEIKKKIFTHTGIPVAIGIGQSKTLAKLASDMAKKTADGILWFKEGMDSILQTICVTDVWGVGSRLGAQLKSYQIFSALDLKKANDSWIRSTFSVVLQKTVWELRSVPCLCINEVCAPKKSITSSRSFGKKVISKADVEQALCSFVATASSKLRKIDQLTSCITVFLSTSPFQGNYYSNYKVISLTHPTDYTPHLMQQAKEGLSAIFIEGLLYKKVGITLMNLSDKKKQQGDFFAHNVQDLAKQTKAMQVLDKIQHKMGKGAISLAAEGIEKGWKGKKNAISPRYTTRWDEILTIQI